MKFSELFNIKRDNLDDWFDPILEIDTKLFIDPFLIYAFETNVFQGSHKETIDFFNMVFSFIAKSNGDPSNVYWKKGLGLLVFPEVQEICLGYTGVGTKGSGSGVGFASHIAKAIWESIQAGLLEITHFEEIALLKEGIGADRISDITASILKYKFVSYTISICDKYKIPVQNVRIYSRFEEKTERWIPFEASLPINPHSSRPILLVPNKYLRDLPTIGADSFWDYARSNENDLLRNDYSLDISKNVKKKDIIEFARKHSECRKRFIDYVESEVPEPYDIQKDKKGIIQWYDATKLYVEEHSLDLKLNPKTEFQKSIKKMLDEFKNYVENNQGWKLLWNDDGTNKAEEAAQSLLLGIIKHYCKANNFDISRETNIGRGPVDFKISSGYELRVLLELKLVKNGKFWNGLLKQLPKYLESEDMRIGYFLIVIYRDRDLKKLNDLQSKIRELNQSLSYVISPIIVDARANPLSASKL